LDALLEKLLIVSFCCHGDLATLYTYFFLRCHRAVSCLRVAGQSGTDEVRTQHQRSDT